MRPLWDSPSTSAFLGVPVTTLDQWAYRGIGPSFRKVGRYRRYRPQDVERWLEEQRTGGAA